MYFVVVVVALISQLILKDYFCWACRLLGSTDTYHHLISVTIKFFVRNVLMEQNFENSLGLTSPNRELFLCSHSFHQRTVYITHSAHPHFNAFLTDRFQHLLLRSVQFLEKRRKQPPPKLDLTHFWISWRRSRINEPSSTFIKIPFNKFQFRCVVA